MGLGVVMVAVVAALFCYWPHILGFITRRPHMVPYSAQTPMQKLIRARLWCIPLIVFVGILVACIRKKHLAGVLFYAIGVGASACLLWGVCMADLFVMPKISEYVNRMPFDSESWKNAEVGDRENPVRLRMVNDLLETYSLEGMSREEIEELLGWCSDYDCQYWLGPERGVLRWDSEYLVIVFKNDSVIDVKRVFRGP